MSDYKPELDGLRAVAIISVVVFHLRPEVLPGGFLGVDVFFVLSGYLISSKILPPIFADGQSVSFSVGQFFLRRVKRLLPATLVLLAAVQCFGAFVLLESEWRLLSEQASAALLACANFYFWWSTGDYWAPEAETMPLLHMWSLSVEEQFYLVFPFLLLLLRRMLASRIPRVAVLVILALSSFTAFIYCRRHHPDAGFFLTPLRAWELLAGCILAEYLSVKRWLQPHNGTYCNIAGLAGLGLIVFGCVTGWGLSVITWRSACLTVIGTVVSIRFSIIPKTVINRLLAFPLPVGIGLISYSLYLWHWPVIAFAGFAGIESPLIIVPCLMMLAVFSYYVVERPARVAENRRFLAIVSALLSIVLLTLALPYVLVRDGNTVGAPVFLADISLDPLNPNPRSGLFTGTRRTGLPLFDASRFAADAVIFGDSHSIMYFPAIREVCDRLKLRLTYFGAGGTSPLFVENREDVRGYGEWRVDDRIEFDRDRIRFLEKNSPRVIFVCARWTLYSMDFYNWTPQRLKTHLEYLRAVCGDALMVFLGQPPEILLTGDVVASGRVIEPPLRVFRETAIATKQRREVHDEIRRFCLQNRNCYFIDTESAFLRDGRPILLDEGECLYIDGDHLSVEGALRVVPLVVEQLVPRLLQDVKPVPPE